MPDAPQPQQKLIGTTALLSISRALAQVANLALLLYAARVLTVAEFGAFSLVAITILILHQTAETGWYELACKHTDPPEELFWCSVIVGIILMFVGILGSAAIYFWFESPKYGLVMLTLSAMPFLGAFAALQNGIHTQRGNVHKIPISVIPAEVLGLAVGIYGLANGYGVFALAMHKLTVLLLIAIIISAWNGWFARPRFRLDQVKEIATFTWQLLLSRVAGFAQGFGGDYLIAALLDLTSVGIYRAGTRIAGAIAEILSETARIISWAKLTKANADDATAEEKSSALEEVFIGIAFIALPAFLGTALIAADAVLLLLGAKWSAAAPVLLFLALSKIVVVYVPILQPVLTFSGDIDRLPRRMVIIAAITLICLSVFASFGTTWAAFSQLIAAIALIPILGREFSNAGGLRLSTIRSDLLKIAAASITMSATVLALQFIPAIQELAVAHRLPIIIVTAGISYAGASLILKPKLVLSALPNRNK